MTPTPTRTRLPRPLALSLALIAAIAISACATANPGADWPSALVASDQLQPMGRVQVKLLKRELRGYTPGGTVVLRLHIDENGGVRKAIIADSSGDAALDAAAARAIIGTRFTPYREQGAPVAVSTLMPLTFRASGQCFSIGKVGC